MQDLFGILRFTWPYLRRYWGRLALGILFGFVYGISNAGAVWGARALFERLAPPPPVTNAQATTTNATGPAAPATSLAAVAVPSALSQWTQRTEAAAKEALNDWLPRSGFKVTGRQVLGTLLLLPLLLAIRGFSGYLAAYCLSWTFERTINDFRVAILEHLSRLSLDFFSRARTGDLVTRISTDTLNLQRSLSATFSDLVKEPVAILGILALLFLINWQLALFAIVFLPFCALPIAVLGRRAKQASKSSFKATSKQAEVLVEFLAGIRTVKAFSLEQQRVARFRAHAGEFIRQAMRGVRAREMINPIIEITSAFALSTLVLYIAIKQVQFSDMVAFLVGTATLYTPIRRISNLHIVFAQAGAATDRIRQILDERPSVQEPATPHRPAPFAQAITFDRVTFAYADRPVLQEINLRIPRGQKVGIAGESGSGKSTLVNLLFRFYDPTAGSLRLDGLDLRQMASADLRSQLALVSQETVIFDMTVAENIACGRPNCSRAEVEAAARAAFAHEFISELPQGYDTPVGERGVTLSGGQRQRLAIARAFVRDAPILVLDEATAALDSNAEKEVQLAIERLEENRTVICVAHRLSTLRDMDRVLVLADGRVVEDGGFEELLRLGGSFAAMARIQGITAQSPSPATAGHPSGTGGSSQAAS